MKKLRWQLLIVVLALAAIAVLLLDQQQQPTLQPLAPFQPEQGGEYTEALVGEFGRLNPVLDSYNPADRDINRLLFSGLVRFDDRGIPVYDLAESMGVNQDGTTYNFSIRPNAVWHDGEPVTSEDIIFTVDLLRDENFPSQPDLRELWQEVEVQAIDEKTISFTLPEPFAPFLDYLTFGILPKHLLEDIPPGDLADADFNLKPVGTGPFRFDHLLGEDGKITGVVLQAFEDYYSDPPYIEQVTFKYYPDAQSALAAYRQEEVKGISQVPGEALPEALKEPNLRLYTGRLPQLSLVYLNLDSAQVPFFQEAAVRRALLMGINRQWIVDRVLNGQALIADGPIFPGTWAYYDAIEHVDYNQEAAKALLDEAGYILPASPAAETEANTGPEGAVAEAVREKGGVRLEFELLHPEGPQYAAIAEVIRAGWAQLGVKATPKAVPYEQLVSEHLEPREYQAALVDLNLAQSPDPDPYPFWDGAQVTTGQNYGQWDDRQASEYLERARITFDLAERARAYRNFQVRFTNEMPALPLFYPVYSYAVDSQVQGVRIGSFFDPSDRFITMPSWYLNEGRAEEAAVSPTLLAPTPTP
jgi:peptide/nickel transport system substrate-binding protein